jgi:hypothetical protein
MPPGCSRHFGRGSGTRGRPRRPPPPAARRDRGAGRRTHAATGDVGVGLPDGARLCGSTSRRPARPVDRTGLASAGAGTSTPRDASRSSAAQTGACGRGTCAPDFSPAPRVALSPSDRGAPAWCPTGARVRGCRGRPRRSRRGGTRGAVRRGGRLARDAHHVRGWLEVDLMVLPDGRVVLWPGSRRGRRGAFALFTVHRMGRASRRSTAAASGFPRRPRRGRARRVRRDGGGRDDARGPRSSVARGPGDR